MPLGCIGHSAPGQPSGIGCGCSICLHNVQRPIRELSDSILPNECCIGWRRVFENSACHYETTNEIGGIKQPIIVDVENTIFNAAAPSSKRTKRQSKPSSG